MRSTREQERLEACSVVNFDRGVLLHRNMIYMFICTKWDEEFPALFRAIRSIQSSSWDQAFLPLDKHFIENKTRRDKLFSHIRLLDKNAGLDDLSKVIGKLNEKNFYDSTKLMFNCVENPGRSECIERINKIPTKDSLKSLLKIIALTPEELSQARAVLQDLFDALKINENEARQQASILLSNELVKKLRLHVIDTFAVKLSTNFNTQVDTKFISNLLLTASAKNKTPWIYDWLHSEKLDENIFKFIIEYPYISNPNFLTQIKSYKEIYNNPFNCSIKNPEDTNNLINFNFPKHLDNYVQVVQNKTQEDYFQFSSMDILGLKLSAEICREIYNNDQNLDFVRLLVDAAGFMKEKKGFDLIKFFFTISPNQVKNSKTLSDNAYFIDYLASPIFSSFVLNNQQISQLSPSFFPFLYDFLKTFKAESYTDLGVLAEKLLSENKKSSLIGLANYWLFFNPDEKNFIFNFLDSHLDIDTDFVSLGNFYLNVLMEYNEVHQEIVTHWVGNDRQVEMTYLALEDFFNNFAGDETLNDFRKFFSRNQIIKVLEVISNGAAIKDEAQTELAYKYSDNYLKKVTKREPYIFKISHDDGVAREDFESKEFLECFEVMAKIELGLYELVRNLPSSCNSLSSKSIAFRAFSWLNAVEKSYAKEFPETNSIWDKTGLLSPYMLNTMVAGAKIIDSTLATESNGGMSYLMDSFRFYLIEKKGIRIVNNLFQEIDHFISTGKEGGQIHRSEILKTFTKEKNFKESNEYFREVGLLLKEHGEWIKSGKWTEENSRKYPNYDPKLDCTKVINQTVAINGCPSKEVVKKHTKNILTYLSTVWDKSTPSAIQLLLKAVKSDEGIEIPLRGAVTKKKVITIKETLNYMYDTSDKSLSVNRLKIPYRTEKNKESLQELTTLERVESVIREVRFGNNYIGTSFLNAIVATNDYNKEAIERKKLLEKCSKIPVVRCGKKMSDAELRMVRNAIDSYDSLIDANNGRGLEPRFQYGDYLKTFEQTLVASSHPSVQEVKLFPFKDEELLKHNGRVLGEMTMMSMWSNTARVLRDRVGRTRGDFDKFINSQRIKRIDRAMIHGFNTSQAGPAAERIIKLVLEVKSPNKQAFLDDIIDWVASLNYQDQRLFEEMIGNILVVSSYIGPEEIVFETPGFGTYQKNNLFQAFLGLEKIIEVWPYIKNSYPQNFKLISAVKSLNNILSFMVEMLEKTNDSSQNLAYHVLNKTFKIMDYVIFDKLERNRIGSDQMANVQGLDLVLSYFKNGSYLENTYRLIDDIKTFSKYFYDNRGQWFTSVGTNFIKISQSKNLNLDSLREYLNFTSKEQVCLEIDNSCTKNLHFDETGKLLSFLAKKHESGKSNVEVMSQTLLVENFDQLNSMIDYLLQSISIKSPPIPYRN